MPDGNLIHVFYDLPAAAESSCAIFQQSGSSEFTLYFKRATDVTIGEVQSDDNMIYKIPAGYPATLELEEVASITTKAILGMYKITMHLNPSSIVQKMGTLTEEQRKLVVTRDGSTPGTCSSPECPGPYICSPPQVAMKVAGVCGCHDPG